MKKALFALLFLGLSTTLFSASLESDFRAPPVATRPHVWWHWLGNSVTKEGIVRDLKAMREAGIGGVTIFTIRAQSGACLLTNSVNSKMSYQNDEWWRLVKTAAEEAERNGLELGMHNCPGFSVSGGPWIPPELAMKRVVQTKTEISGGARVVRSLQRPYANLGFYRDIAVVAMPAVEDPKPESVYVLTDKMAADGTLTWNAPTGKWRVFRVGYTLTIARPRPAPEDVQDRSLEADKFSREAMTVHLRHVIPPLKQHLGRFFGTSFKHLLLDSYEAGDQSWTEGFDQEFLKRRGYDLTPWLPVLAKQKIGGVLGDRFLEDFNKTVEELFTENHFQLFSEWAQKAGLILQVEPYGGPFDPYEAAASADVPMVEFWGFRTFWMGPRALGGYPNIAGAVGRAMGRNVIATEAFTGMPMDTGWIESPRNFKNSGDATFARGINRMTLHHWVHQPFATNLRPGMTMGAWGSHFGQCQTWHEPGKAFYAYLGRCQALLQRGEQVVDQLALMDQPRASELDAIPERVFLKDLSVLPNGRVALPSGRSYPLLRLPKRPSMSLEVALKLKELVMAGATVWGAAPKRVRGLRGYPQADAQLAACVDELWGMNRKGRGEHRFGKGRVVWGGTPQEVLDEMGYGAGFMIHSGDPDHWVLASHRVDHGIPYFFVANTGSNTMHISTSFRVIGRTPEFWHPQSLRLEKAVQWEEKNGRTFMPLTLRPNQAYFVVFRDSSEKEDPIVRTGIPGVQQLSVDRALFRAKDTGEVKDVTAAVRNHVGIRSLCFQVDNPQLGGDPFPNRFKQLELTCTVNGKQETRIYHERSWVRIPSTASTNAAVTFGRDEKGAVWVSECAGKQLAVTRSGREFAIPQVRTIQPMVLDGAWKVAFPAKHGAPDSITLDSLQGLHLSPLPGVRYFSGTASYRKEFSLPEGSSSGSRQWLDLGDVRELAEVSLNGTPLGVLWYPPFRVEVTGLLRTGKNALEVRVTNTWANRMIGDHVEPDDCQWSPFKVSKDGRNVGRGLTLIPDWAIQNKPRPSSGRFTFCMWDYFKPDSPLLPSGLIGPVRIVSEMVPLPSTPVAQSTK